MTCPRVPLDELNASLAAGGYGPSFRGVPKKGAKRARKAQPEEALQIDLAKDLAWMIGPPLRCNHLGVMWVAIEQASGKRSAQKNAKTGKTFDIAGQRRRAKGCRPGLADLKFWWPGHRGWIEMKVGKNDTTDNQDEAHAELRKAGDLVETCWSKPEVFETLRKWGVPLRAA